jgi:hypothetical protein
MHHKVWESLDRLVVLMGRVGGHRTRLSADKKDDVIVETLNEFAKLCNGHRDSQWDFVFDEIRDIAEYRKLQSEKRMIEGVETVGGLPSKVVYRAEVLVRNDGIGAIHLVCVSFRASFKGRPDEAFAYLEQTYQAWSAYKLLLDAWDSFLTIYSQSNQTKWTLDAWGVGRMIDDNGKYVGRVEWRMNNGGIRAYHLQVMLFREKELRSVKLNVVSDMDETVFSGDPKSVFQFLNDDSLHAPRPVSPDIPSSPEFAPRSPSGPPPDDY